MIESALLVEVDAVSPAGVAKTLRFSDRAVRPFPPSDPDRANAVWWSILQDPPTFRRALFDDIRNLAPSIGAGAMALLNSDGALNPYEGFAWNEIRVLRWTFGTPFAAAVLVLKGLCAVPSYDHHTSQARMVRVDIYDYRAELEKALLGPQYAGTNNGTTILYEGSADGLKGRSKPLALGDLSDAHLPPVQVNGPASVFQLHDGAIQGPVAIFDGGAPAGYANQGDKTDAVFDATTPAAASYITNHNRGLVKINGSPVMGLTFAAKGGSAGGYVETVGPVAARLLAKAGVPPERIGASVAALLAAQVIGLYANDQAPAGDLLAWTARSALTSVLPDTSGVYQAVTFGPPAADAVASIAADQVLNLAPDQASLGPIGEIRVAWGKISTTFSSGELKASVRISAEAERLATDYRFATRDLAAVKARYPRSWSTVTVETALRTEAAALALAEQLEGLFGLRPDGKPRRAWRVTISTLDGLVADLGDTVALTYPPQDINDNFVLFAEEPMRPSRDQAIWTLWG